MLRIKWPVAVATLFAILLGWYILYTQQLYRALQSNAATLTEIYSEVQEGLASPDPGRADDALFRLQTIIREADVPLVWTGPRDTVLAVTNLPFDADPRTQEGQERVRSYVRRLDQRHPPVGDAATGLLHFGDSP